LATNLIMTIIAISLSFFTAVPSYAFGAVMENMATMTMPVISLNRFADQQIGAAILWVCGDFWCFPALYIAFRRSMTDTEGSEIVDRLLKGHRRMSVEEFRGEGPTTLASSLPSHDESTRPPG
jgi:hypothetical protein